jgi:hypothetical protein
VLESKPKSSPPKVTRGERQLLKHVRAAGVDGIYASQLEDSQLDSIQRDSVRVLVSRMVKKGLLYSRVVEKRRYKIGRPRLIYLETQMGKEIDL